MINELKKTNIFYKKYELINFINTNENEKKLILEWRNDENVRKWMVNKNIITMDEHLRYIDSLKHKDDKLCFIVKCKEGYLGIIEFDKIDLINKEAYFGLNMNPNCNLLGIGTSLLDIISMISSANLHLRKLLLYVFEDNIKAINLYKKMNFHELKSNILNKEKILYMEKIL